jgi:hypothetical protein
MAGIPKRIMKEVLRRNGPEWLKKEIGDFNIY